MQSQEPRGVLGPRLCIPAVLAAIAATLLWGACGEGTGPEPPALAAVVVTSPIDTLLAVGGTAPFHAVAFDAAGDSMSGVSFTWQSSAPTVATVDGSGRVIGVGAGSATISATADGRSGSLRVSVLAADLPGIEALVADPLFLVLISHLGSATGSEINDALSAFTEALTEGNLVVALNRLETMKATLSAVTGADDAVLSGVLSVFLDHAHVLFNL